MFMKNSEIKSKTWKKPEVKSKLIGQGNKAKSKEELQELDSDKLLKRKELSILMGVKPSTIEFYSNRGILPYVQRDPNGYRFYEKGVSVKILSLIYKLKEQRLSIEEIEQELRIRNLIQ
jgi:hypothetical protein